MVDKNYVELEGNHSLDDYEEYLLCATLAGLSISAIPLQNPGNTFCLMIDSRQKAEYATFEAIRKMARKEMTERMLEYGVPKKYKSELLVLCPIGKEKLFFQKDFPYKNECSDLYLKIPNTVPIDWVKIAKYAEEYKKNWIKEHPSESDIVINIKEPSKKEISEEASCNFSCNSHTMQVLEDFDFDNL